MKDEKDTAAAPVPAERPMTDLEQALAHVETIENPHRRRLARAKLMGRVVRWVKVNPPSAPKLDADGNKLPPKVRR